MSNIETAIIIIVILFLIAYVILKVLSETNQWIKSISKNEDNASKKEEATKPMETTIMAKENTGTNKNEKKITKQGEVSTPVGLTIIIVAGFLMWNYGKSDSHSPRTQLSKQNKEIIWMEKSKDGVKSRLKDPDSAKFRGLFVSHSSGSPVTCGEVNSKNSLGGYTGYQAFVAGGDTLVFFANDTTDFFKVWQKLCLK